MVSRHNEVKIAAFALREKEARLPNPAAPVTNERHLHLVPSVVEAQPVATEQLSPPALSNQENVVDIRTRVSRAIDEAPTNQLPEELRNVS